MTVSCSWIFNPLLPTRVKYILWILEFILLHFSFLTTYLKTQNTGAFNLYIFFGCLLLLCKYYEPNNSCFAKQFSTQECGMQAVSTEPCCFWAERNNTLCPLQVDLVPKVTLIKKIYLKLHCVFLVFIHSSVQVCLIRNVYRRSKA